MEGLRYCQEEGREEVTKRWEKWKKFKLTKEYSEVKSA